jgi:predicted nucleic acid-binding protein
MKRRALVLDANILIRAVLGRKVFALLNQYQSRTAFFAPDVAFMDAEKYLPDIFAKRGFDWSIGSAMMDRLPVMVQRVQPLLYRRCEAAARSRIRDIQDWPILATALALNCPIWTEDADFFGCGVATWTTANIALYLQRSK